MRSTAFKTLHGLFSSVAGPQGLTHQDSVALISVSVAPVLTICWPLTHLSLSTQHLYSYQPNLLDAQLLNAWLTVMDAAHNRLPEDVCLQLLPKFFSCCVGCLLAGKSFVRGTAASIMEVSFNKNHLVFFCSSCSFSMCSCFIHLVCLHFVFSLFSPSSCPSLVFLSFFFILSVFGLVILFHLVNLWSCHSSS